MKKALIVFTILTGMGLSSFSQSKNDNRSFDQDSLIIHTTLEGITSIYYSGASYINKPGAPSLPYFQCNYLIPYSARLDTIIITSKTKESIQGSFFISPAQSPIILDGSLPPPEVGPDSAIYVTNEFYPAEQIELRGTNNFMGYRLISFKLYPVEYNPVDSVINLYTSIDFSIHYSEDTIERTLPNRITVKRYNLLRKYISGMIDNPDDMDIINGGGYNIVNDPSGDFPNFTFPPSSTSDIPDYIIITTESFEFPFESLAFWKTKKGVPTMIVTLNEITSYYPGVDTQEKIRNYLIDVYNHWGAGIFVLLGGDIEHVPSRYVYYTIYFDNFSHFSDLYYVTTEGNWNANGNQHFGEYGDDVDVYPKFFYGRAPVDDRDQVWEFIDKVKSYEKPDPPAGFDFNYINNSASVRGFLKKDLCDEIQPTYSMLDSYTCKYDYEHLVPDDIYNNRWYIFDNPLCNYYSSIYYPNDPWSCDIGGSCIPANEELSRLNVLELLNNTSNFKYFHLVFHEDHSGTTTMGTSLYLKGESINKTDIQGLHNLLAGPYHQIILSNGCHTTEFDFDDCIAEEFVMNTNGGSAAFIGPSGVGLQGQGIFRSYFFRALYDSPEHPGSHSQIGLPFLNASNTSLNYGKHALYRRLTLLGDPEMNIWTAPPDIDLVVSYNPVEIYTCSNTLTLNIDNIPSGTNATICFYKEDEVYIVSEYTGSEMQFDIEPSTSGILHLTVTAANRIPVEIEIDVLPNPDVCLNVTGLNWDDSNGNGDGKIDSGEEITLSVEVNNSGESVAMNTNGVLSNELVLRQESFEGSEFPPPSWTIQNDLWDRATETTNPPGINMQDGDYLCRFKSSQTTGTSVLLMPPLRLFNASLKFWMYHETGAPSSADKISFEIRAVKEGYNWQNIGDYYRNDWTTGWFEHVIDISGYGDAELYQIRIFGQGEGGNDIHIDNVSIVDKVVTMIATNSSYGPEPNHQINPGESVWCNTDYSFIVEPSIEIGQQLPFELSITSNVFSGTDKFYLPTYAPDIQFGINSYLTEDGDMSIEDGEEVYIYFELINSGTGQASAITGQISSEDERIDEIIVDQQIYGSLDPDQSLTNSDPFVFKVVDPLPGFTKPISVDLAVEDLYGRNWIFTTVLSFSPPVISNPLFDPYCNSIFLTWEGSFCKGYFIYRLIDNNWIKLNEVPVTYKYYEDNFEIAPNEEYRYGIAAFTNHNFEGPMYEFDAWSSLPIHAGWPVELDIDQLGHRVEGAANIGDIDGNGSKEIFLTTSDNDWSPSTGSVVGLKHDGTFIFDETPGGFYKFTNTGARSIPAIADVNADWVMDVIVPTLNGSGQGYKLSVVAFTNEDSSGDGMADVIWNYSTNGPNVKGVAIANVDNSTERTFETMNASFYNNGSDPDEIFLITDQGDDFNINWPITLPFLSGNFAMPAIADLDNNGEPEIIIGFREGICAYLPDGSALNENPIFSIDDIPDNLRMDSPPVIADLDDDGLSDIIFTMGNEEKSVICAIDIYGNFISGWEYGSNYHNLDFWNVRFDETYYGLFPSPSVGDINGDGRPEVLCMDRNELNVWDYTGQFFENFPIEMDWLDTRNFVVPLVADVDDDADLEIIVGGAGNKIHAYNWDGSAVVGFPLIIGENKTTPVVGDVDYDGLNEIICNSGTKIFVWDSEGDANKIEWGSYRHDRFNSGNYHNAYCRKFYDEISITTDDEWSDTVLVQDVRIYSGSVLTITGRVSLPEDARIIVERGAKLVLDGGTLTNACENTWKGIEVWGNSLSGQYPTTQGWVVCQNESKIMNSEMGIYTNRWNPDTEGWVANYTGGIVQVSETEFINNGKGIQFFSYPSATVSYVSKSTFRINDGYIGSKDPKYFIEANGIVQLYITNCDFLNESSSSYLYYGLSSVNSIIHVDGECIEGSPCTAWDNCLFQNLKYGIYATATSTERHVSIRHSDFNDNKRGIYIGGMTNAVVTNNNFSINSLFSGMDGGYGLYLDHSTGYKVEENNFYHEGQEPQGVGLIVHHSGSDPNEIYRNWFTNLTQGISCQEKNREGAETGLQILCNDFSDCEADLLIPKPMDKGWGIAPSQGIDGNEVTDMAGNLFYIPPGIPNGDFDDVNNEGAFIDYYFPENPGPGFDNSEPEDYTSFSVEAHENYIQNVQMGWTFEEGCPPDEAGGGGGQNGTEGMRSDLAAAQQEISSLENTLAILVDGGDTETLNTEVENSLPPETVEVYTELMGKSPYLSDTVVATSIEKEDVLPNAMIRDVMVANPHSSKSDVLMEKLDERSVPLPDYMKAHILQGRSIVSLKNELESKLAGYKLKKSRAFNGLSRYFVNDTLSLQAAMDSLLLLYQQDQDLQTRYRLAMLHLEKDEYQQGEYVLSNIPTQYDLSGNESAIHQNFVSYYNLARQIRENGQTMLEADSLQLQSLLNIESGPGIAGAWARAILTKLGELNYEEPIQLPDLMKSSEDIERYYKLLNTEQPPLLSVFPNPSKEYVILEYMMDAKTKAVIGIQDLSGKNIHTVDLNSGHDQITVITKDWEPGVYIASLRVSGKSVESVKFTISD